MELTVQGRTALVTGGGTGIGKAIAVALAGAGANLAITYYSHPDEAFATAEEIRALGRKAYLLKLDASDSHQVENGVPEAARLLDGRIDILVNNAGSLVARMPVAEMSIDYWRKVMAVNLDSAFYVTRYAMPYMSGGWGRIIFLSSLAAHTGGGVGAAAYSAAKAGLLGLTRGLAKELGLKGITVNALAPGLILETHFHNLYSTPEIIQSSLAGIPLGISGEPGDVAGAALYLASDLGRFITGETIEINGGAWFV